MFSEHERKLDLYLRRLSNNESDFVPYSLAWDTYVNIFPILIIFASICRMFKTTKTVSADSIVIVP